MQSKHRPVEIIVRGVRWALPWMVVLWISSSIAYAMTVSVAGGAAAPANAAVDPSAATLVSSSTATTGFIDRFPSHNACDASGTIPTSDTHG